MAMTPDEQRQALAEWLGWRLALYIDTFEGGSGRTRWRRPDGSWYGMASQEAQLDNLPDFRGNLNAVNQVEQRLDEQTYRLFVDTLVSILPKGEFAVRADAQKRSEALCRTLWPERWAC